MLFIEKSPRAKRLTLKVKHDGSIHVTVPRFVTIRRAQKFVIQQDSWIQKRLQNLTTKDLHPLTEDEISDLRKQAKEYLPDHTHQLATLHQLKIGSVTIRHQKTRWGSCSSKKQYQPQLWAHAPSWRTPWLCHPPWARTCETQKITANNFGIIWSRSVQAPKAMISN